MAEMKHIPPFSYAGGRIPNEASPTPHIKIRDRGFIVRLNEHRLEGEMMVWAWMQGKRPVFNFVSEGRDFSKSDRCLILATSFYEYTAPEEQKPKIKLQDHHQFTLKGHEWFWIPGIVKNDCFTMLTVKACDVDRGHAQDRRAASFMPLGRRSRAVIDAATVLLGAEPRFWTSLQIANPFRGQAVQRRFAGRDMARCQAPVSARNVIYSYTTRFRHMQTRIISTY
jgi:hypothetical protein